MKIKLIFRIFHYIWFIDSHANGTIIRTGMVRKAEKSLRYYGPKIWNSLPFHVKTSENLKTFKDIIKNWNGSTCNCRVCQS